GSGPVAVAVGDFNRDGKLDLAVADYGSGCHGYLCNTSSTTVSVLLGNGDGTFQAPRTFVAGIGPNSVAVGDFNGDGILDLAVANYISWTVSVLLGSGDGAFRAVLPALSPDRGPTSVVVGDFNGDGIQDLAVAHYRSTTVSVLLGHGDGTFG